MLLLLLICGVVVVELVADGVVSPDRIEFEYFSSKIFTLPPPGTCFTLSNEPIFDRTFQSNFCVITRTFPPSKQLKFFSINLGLSNKKKTKTNETYEVYAVHYPTNRFVILFPILIFVFQSFFRLQLVCVCVCMGKIISNYFFFSFSIRLIRQIYQVYDEHYSMNQFLI